MNKENVYAPPESELETPTNEIPLASRWARLWGALIDTFIISVITFPLLYLTGYWDKSIDQTISGSEMFLIAVLSLVAFVLLHGYLLAKHGQTIGKKIVGTRIVSRATDEILPLWKVFILRYLPVTAVGYIPMVGSLLVVINYLFIFGKSKRCLHDLIAGTKVVKASPG